MPKLCARRSGSRKIIWPTVIIAVYCFRRELVLRMGSFRCRKSFFWEKFLARTKELHVRVECKRRSCNLSASTALPASYLTLSFSLAKNRADSLPKICSLPLEERLFIFISVECAAKRNICINKCNYVTPKSAAATSAQKWLKCF